MIETWLAQKAVRIAILVAALLCPLAMIGCTVETVKLHGIAFHLPLFGTVELAHGALADTAAAQAARDTALKDLGTARTNEVKLGAGLKTCDESVDQLQIDADAAKKAAEQKVKDVQAKASADLKTARAAIAKIKSTAETCPVAEAILRAALQ